MPYSSSQKDLKLSERKQSTNTNTKTAEMLALSKVLQAYIIGSHGCVPGVPALGRLRQEVGESRASLNNV